MQMFVTISKGGIMIYADMNAKNWFTKVIEKGCKSSCTICVVLITIIFAINIGIGTYFLYYKYMNRNKENVSRYDYVYQATNC